MRIGYARVSTEDQSLDLQRRALLAAGCETVFEDHGVSGAAVRRPNLDQALAALNPGDVLVVWKLDRLGRSLLHLVETIRSLGEQDIGFLSLNDSIDTTSPGGRLMLHVLAAFAEFERELVSERTRAGMQARKARGEPVGRRRKLLPQQIEEVKQLIVKDGRKVSDIAHCLNVSRSTIYRTVMRYREKI